MEGAERKETWDEFRELVNMKPGELEKWLDSEQSRSAGRRGDGGEDLRARDPQPNSQQSGNPTSTSASVSHRAIRPAADSRKPQASK